VLVIVCPGQGSQSPGFLSPWLELPGVTEQLEWLSVVSGIDLVTHGTVSDADTIRDTAVAQPLIVAAGLVTASQLGPVPALAADVVAGHSVGEFTAAALAGVLSPEQSLVLVRERGRAMAAASAVTPTGMSAVVGGDPDEVAAVLATHGLTAANANGGGQVVAAGTLEQLAALAAQPPAKARVIPLQVAGAFHTHHMAPAVDALARLAGGVRPGEPVVPLLSNADGRPVSDGASAVAALVNQISNPVRWDSCMNTLADLGVTGMIELAPGGTLMGLAKRGLRGVQAMALKTPDDLDAARTLLTEHSSGIRIEPALDVEPSGATA
jgi:[acyl-carrier-protein] S-malonyltransferase